MHQPTLGDLFAQALGRSHDAVAIIDGDRSYTYGMLSRRVGQLLAFFTQRGYPAGYRVGLALPMGFDFLSWYIATQIGGLACCDLPPSMPIAALQQRVTGGQFGTVVLQLDAFAGKIDDLSAVFDAELLLSAPASEEGSLEALLQEIDPEPVRSRPAGEFSTILFTGGSTGAPKAQGFSGEAGAALAIMVMAVVPFPAAPVTVAYRTGLPVLHLGLNQTLIRSGKIITLPNFDLEAINGAARKHHANNFYLATRTISTLADQADIEWMRDNIQLIFHGGEPIAPTQLSKALGKLGPVFVASYGSSETGGMSAYLLPEDHDPDRPDRLMSAGRALPGVDIEVRDEAGVPQGPGGLGEVVIRSPGQMECYIGQPEKTAYTIRDGWIYTGDVGRIDADGYLTIVDRTAFAIKWNGRTVYPRLIDAHLSEHPAVSTAVTIPIESPGRGGRICAAVILRNGMSASEGELLRFLADGRDTPTVDDVVILSHLPQMPGNLKIDREKVRVALEEAIAGRPR